MFIHGKHGIYCNCLQYRIYSENCRLTKMMAMITDLVRTLYHPNKGIDNHIKIIIICNHYNIEDQAT